MWPTVSIESPDRLHGAVPDHIHDLHVNGRDGIRDTADRELIERVVGPLSQSRIPDGSPLGH